MAPEKIEFWWTAIVWVSVTVAIVIAFVSVLLGQARTRLRIQKEKLDAIEKSRKEYIDLFESVSDIVYIHDAEGRISTTNHSTSTLLGLDPASIAGKTLFDLFPSHRVAVKFYLGRLATAVGQVEGVVPVWSQKLSRMLVFEYRCSPERDNGRLLFVRGIARDITERTKRRRELEKSRTRIESLLRNEKAMREQLRKFSQEILRIQEDERLWVSHELHDEIGQYLASVLFNLEILRTDKERFSADYDLRLDDTRSVAEGVLERVRKFLTELRPAPIEAIGICDSLETLVEGFRSRTGVSVDYRKYPVLESLPYEQKVCLYRVVQECLTNIAKHAHASDVAICVTQENAHLLIDVRDNGSGFDEKERSRKSGLGLIGMRERLEVAQGDLLIESSPGKGTVIHIRFTLENS